MSLQAMHAEHACIFSFIIIQMHRRFACYQRISVLLNSPYNAVYFCRCFIAGIHLAAPCALKRRNILNYKAEVFTAGAVTAFTFNERASAAAIHGSSCNTVESILLEIYDSQ
jgi:hypothetical protein